MKTIIITILATGIFDFGAGLVLKKRNRKKRNAEMDSFNDALRDILLKDSDPFNLRIQKAKELCRNTKGSMAAGAYLALDYVSKMLCLNS